MGWSSDDAVKHYLARMSAKIPHFETMEERELNFIKVNSVEQASLDPVLRTKSLDDQRRRKNNCEQLHVWLLVP